MIECCLSNMALNTLLTMEFVSCVGAFAPVRCRRSSTVGYVTADPSGTRSRGPVIMLCQGL